MYASMDMVVEKLERQIKHKQVSKNTSRCDGARIFINEKIDEDDYDIVRTKRFPLKPMNTEAILQMNLLPQLLFL